MGLDAFFQALFPVDPPDHFLYFSHGVVVRENVSIAKQSTYKVNIPDGSIARGMSFIGKYRTG